MKVSELTGATLDYWVAKAGDTPFYDMETNWPGNHHVNTEQLERPVIIRGLSGRLSIEHRNEVAYFSPSSNWEDGGPIIEREGMSIDKGAWLGTEHPWQANAAHGYIEYGPTPLVAAMRAYVASKFGDEVPDESV